MTPIDDDELQAMLEARAGRASLDPVSVVAEGRRRALEPVHAGSSGRGVGWPVVALGSLAAAAAVILLVVVPLTFRPAASPTPSVDEPTASVGGPAPTPHSADSPITAAELDPAMGDTTAFVGLTIALQGELVADPTPCPTAADCGLRVAGLSRPHTLVAVEGEDLPTLPASGRIEGIFAIRFTERTLDDGRLVFEDVGPIVPAADGLAWPIPTLAAGGDGLPTGLIAATGWIVRTPLHPCPAGQGCDATEDYLTAGAYQPAQIDGSVVGPPTETSINLPAGSYDAWAPEPNAMAEGVEPRPATLLLRLVKGAPCGLPSGVAGATACPVPSIDSWQVVGRLDPPPFVQPVAPPDPTPLPTPKGSAAPLPPAATERLPGGFPTAINGEPVLVGLEAQARWREATDDTSFLVGGK